MLSPLDIAVARRRRLLLAPTVQDAHYTSVSSLLHMDGANGSTTFTDVKGLTWSVTGSAATIVTAQNVYGGASAQFGSGSRITTATTAGFGFGTGDFTIEFRMRPTTLASAYRGIFDMRVVDGTMAPNMHIANNTLVYREGNSVRITSAGLISVDTWYAVALTRVGTSVKMWLNGVQVGSTYTGATDLGSTMPCALGCFGAGVAVDDAFKFLGQIDE
jgi:hypothetical protein